MYDYSFRTTFGVGAKVRLIRQRKYPEYKLLNLVGTVRTDTGNNVSVIFDDVTNTRSQYGCFYFKAVDLVEADADNNIMEENNMSKITNYFNSVRIQFINEKFPCEYVYANFEHDLKVGDLCIVKPAHHDFSLARITEIIPRNDIELTREIVAKVYTDCYDERVASRAKAAELKAKMQERARQLQDIALYQMLAKDDPEMQTLLEEYQAVPKI